MYIADLKRDRGKGGNALPQTWPKRVPGGYVAPLECKKTFQRPGLHPRPLWEAYCAPKPPSWQRRGQLLNR